MHPSFKKICLIGAESTGKSTLATALASQLRDQGHWAQCLPETLRLFCERRGRVPQAEDQSWIFHAQVLAELEAEQAWHSLAPRRDGWLICDGSALQTAFYSRWFFASDDLLAPALEHQAGYARCFVLDPVLPWVADGIQRDSPEARLRVNQDLHHFLQQQQVAHETLTPVFDAVSRASATARALAQRLSATAGSTQQR